MDYAFHAVIVENGVVGHIEGLERSDGLEVFDSADFVVAEVEDFE
jgi:hypothetical protein